MKFLYEHIASKEDLMKQIDECEGKHTQQAIYSTFHSAITQVCFGCRKIRSTIHREFQEKGLDRKTWNGVLDKYLCDQPMLSEEHESMNDEQRWMIHELDKAKSRLEAKK